MGRKRLLTILAGAVAVVGLHMGPAAALDTGLVDPIKNVLDGVDSEIAEQCKGEDTVALVEKCVERLEASLSSSTDEVESTSRDATTTTKKATETVKESTKSTTDGGTGDTSTPTKPSSSSDGSGSSGGSTSASGSSSSGDDVAAAGGAQSAEASHERPRALDPEEARRFLASSRESLDTSGPRGDVTPAFDLSDLDDPLVAGPGTADRSSENEWQAASPETAPPRSDAELAAIPAESPGDVPAGLKLVAALLVAGTGTLWHLTRRELQPVKA